MKSKGKSLWQRFRGCESGSAMTEFVIGLPVYVLIFSGMGMLYTYNSEALLVQSQAYAALQADSFGKTSQMVPLVGAATSVDSMGDLFTSGLSAGGIYVDSYAKVKIPEMLLSDVPEPHYLIGDIMGSSDDYVGHRLLNDMVDPTWNGGSFAGVFMSLVQTSGAGPAIGAGIRYGASEGEASRSFSHPWGDQTFESGKLTTPAPTAATHRLAPVLLTRLEFSLTERFDESIPVFDTSLNMDSEQMDTVNDASEKADECKSQVQTWSNCSNAYCRWKKEPDSSCQKMGKSNPLENLDKSWESSMP